MWNVPRSIWIFWFASSLAACSGGGSGSSGLARDTDGDGLPDVLERQLASDPRDADDPYLEGAQDDDTNDGPGPDGIPDGLERYLRAGGSRNPITAVTESDNDGVPDYLEVASLLDPRDPDVPTVDGRSDLDDAGGPAMDGITDAMESYLLRRGARPPLTRDSDTDADGIADVYEVRSGSDPFDALDPPYARAFDVDRDQVPDWLERKIGSDPLLSDFPTFDGDDDDDGGVLGPDGDGVKDGLEGWLFRAGAVPPVTTATDSDADGIPDVAEVRAGFDPFDAASPLAGGEHDGDGDGIADGLALLLLTKSGRAVTRVTDSDADRIHDFAEVLAGSSPFERADPTLFGHFDLDGDGLHDFLEYELGSDALDRASPQPGELDGDDATGPGGDPIPDFLERYLIERGASAPVTTYSDSDGDGVPDFVELRWVADMLAPDSPIAGGAGDRDDPGGPAGDGVSDAAEQVMLLLGADAPLDTNRNSDRDVIPDWIELVTGSDWLSSISPPPNLSPDIDGDGALDHLELVLGFDPRSADDPLVAGGNDSDRDGLSDALEELLALTGTPAPITPLSDSDGDGLYDHLELRLASDRHDGSSPLLDGGADHDDRTGPPGDGLSDALEYYLVRSGAPRPVTTLSDSDGDGLPDHLEASLALDIFDARSPLPDGAADDDGDGVSNGLEFALLRVGATPPVDGRTDTDRDGAPDHLEILAGSNPLAGDLPLPGGAADTDGDGLSDALEFVLLAVGAEPPLTQRNDTDGDGISDGYEVRSGTHPLRSDHPFVNGGADVLDATGPSDTISDGLEALLVRQGAVAPVTRATDSDLDGAPDHLEVIGGGLPLDRDSPVPNGALDGDGDQMSNALESVLLALGALDPLDTRSDTDADGAPDRLEVLTAAHPVDPDVPIQDGDAAGLDADESTGPNGDRVSDAFELLLIAIGCTPPIKTESDHDRDGLPDAFEVRFGTNPLDGDSPLAGGGTDTNNATGPAGDLLSDALEAFLIAHGARGPVTLTTDTDRDGVPDFYEVVKGSDPFSFVDEILPGTKPMAVILSIAGWDFLNRTITGSYHYRDAELDPEGATTVRWLRDGVPIPGEVSSAHEITMEDLGRLLSFEVTPVSLYAWPPTTSVGNAVRTGHVVPIPVFPQGTGGPGGVGATGSQGDIRLWLRADQGVTTSGAAQEVRRWRDLSGGQRDATDDPSRRRPVLVNNLGPRPAVRFDGFSHLMVPRPVENSLTIAAAFQTTSRGGNPSFSWLNTPAILASPYCDKAFHFGMVAGRARFATQVTMIESEAGWADGLPHSFVATRARGTGTLALYLDGVERDSEVTGQSASLTCATTYYVGSNNNANFDNGFWRGDLFELCAFDRVLNVVERRLLDAYFWVRTGVQPAATLYASPGTHGGDLAGIGRDATGALVEEAEGTGLVRVSAPSALSDGDYLLWGTDRPGDYSLSADVPVPFERRLRRIWAYTITDGGAGDGVGTVNVRFRVRGLFLSPLAKDFGLLLDDDGLFADAEIFPRPGTYDASTDTIEFAGVQLGGHPFFALAVTPIL